MAPYAGEGLAGLSVEHAVSLSVRDSAALLDATSGPDIGDPYWAPPPAGPFLAEVGRDPGRLRIALTTTPWNGKPVDPQCADAAQAAARLCERLGHHVEEARPTIDAEALAHASRVIVSANVRNVLDLRGAARGRPVTQDEVEPETWRRMQDAAAFTAADYARSTLVVHRTGRAVARFFTGYDILLTPTMACTPYPLGVIDMSTADVDGFYDAVLRSIAFTSLFNSSGNPAMSVPLAWSREGLPLGVQFVAPFGDEARLFRLAAQLESTQPWANRRPLAA
jgi:Asp-tRNA(Asn)/Glu-tRNA(Gln) amidotransferase A subunit family amidase